MCLLELTITTGNLRESEYLRPKSAHLVFNNSCINTLIYKIIKENITYIKKHLKTSILTPKIFNIRFFFIIFSHSRIWVRTSHRKNSHENAPR